MQCRRYQTVYTLAITDPTQLWHEAISGNRIGMWIELGGFDEKLAQEQMDELLQLREETKEAVDKLTEIYSSHTDEFRPLRQKYLDRYKAFWDRRRTLKQLYESPEENRIKILAMISENPDKPVDLSLFGDIKSKESLIESAASGIKTPETVAETVIKPETIKPEIPTKPQITQTPTPIDNKQTKTIFSKIKDFAKNNKVVLGAIALIAFIAGIGAFLYLRNKKKAADIIKTPATTTLLKNVGFSDFANKNCGLH